MIPPVQDSRPAERELGVSFVELMFAMSIVGVALLVMLQQLTLSYRENDISREKVFAYQKALALYAELQASVERGDVGSPEQLEARSDLAPTPVLTTLNENGTPLDPDHPSSGNRMTSDGWLWRRFVSVRPVAGSAELKQVRITVSRRESGSKFLDYATVSGVLTVPGNSHPSVQTYDVYVVALSTAPSLWMSMPSLRATIAAATDQLESRNPGLRVRLRWITESGYGRDACYRPYFNTSQRAIDAAPFAYWYPSRVDEVSPSLFSADQLAAAVQDESGLLHGFDAEDNPHPYAVADRFNHAMRLPEARQLFDARVAAGLCDPQEPPLQILLEDMHADPGRFRNAIVVNLHGGLLPFPPLRNVSDAAKDPAAHAGVRVVTHPARLRPARDPNGDGLHDDTDDVEFRVHAYKRDPDSGPAVLSLEPITVDLPGVDLTANVNGADPSRLTTLEIRRLVGGVDPQSGLTTSGTLDYFGFDSSTGLPPERTAATEPFEMSYSVTLVTVAGKPTTRIQLWNTPLVATPFGGRGLAVADRLWGMEYVPSPVGLPGPAGDFPIDLASSSAGPKNTARWRLRIPKSVFDVSFPGGMWTNLDTVVTAETRIGSDASTGAMWPAPNAPANRSVTWAWWAAAPEAVPVTERFQLHGDPRHLPYADCVSGGASFPDAYNWFFDDLRDGAVDATSGWPCLDAAKLHDGFDVGAVPFDVPRALQIWRDATERAAVSMTLFGGPAITGVVTGGEVCLPQTGTSFQPVPLMVHGNWYGSTTTVRIDTVSEAGAPPASPGGGGSLLSVASMSVPEYVGLANVVGGSFEARPWLGELVPDAEWPTWESTGNLAAGGSGATYRMQKFEDARWDDAPAGTQMARPTGRLCTEFGARTLFQVGDPAATFAQPLAVAGSTLVPTEPTREVFRALGLGLPTTLPGVLTLDLESQPSTPLPHVAFPGYPWHSAQPLATLSHDSIQTPGSVVMRLLSPTGTRSSCWTVLADTPTIAAEKDWLARAVGALSLHGFFVAGEPSWGNDVPVVPRVIMLEPVPARAFEDPAGLVIRWRTAYQRFDGGRYTAKYPEGWAADESRQVYSILVSDDGGETWRYAINGAAAEPGRRPEDPGLLLVDAGIGDETYAFSVPPSAYPEGKYTVRVECFDAVRFSHVGHHQVEFEIVRTAAGGGGR